MILSGYMKKTFIFSLLLFMAMFNIKSFAQENGGKKNSSNVRTEFFAYPYVFYTPEKKLAFGGGGILSMQDTSRALAKPSKFVFSDKL